MPPKSYVPNLKKKMKSLKKYIQKWDVQLPANMTSGQFTKVEAALDAVVTSLNDLPDNPEVD